MSSVERTTILNNLQRARQFGLLYIKAFNEDEANKIATQLDNLVTKLSGEDVPEEKLKAAASQVDAYLSYMAYLFVTAFVNLNASQWNSEYVSKFPVDHVLDSFGKQYVKEVDHKLSKALPGMDDVGGMARR